MPVDGCSLFTIQLHPHILQPTRFWITLCPPERKQRILYQLLFKIVDE